MSGLGYFLGATFGAAIIFFIISFIFLRPREINNDQIDKFIKDSDKILIKEPIPFLSKFLGATFGAAIIFFIISFIFLRPRDVTSNEIKRFIISSEFKKVIVVPYVGGILSKDDERLGVNIISKMTFFSNRNMTYVMADTYTYFSKELNKYVLST